MANDSTSPDGDGALTPSPSVDSLDALGEGTPELRKLMINSNGALVFKPEYEHESIHYKSTITSGAYTGSKLQVLDSDPVDRFVREQYHAMRVQVHAGLGRVQHGIRSNVTRLKNGLTTGISKAQDSYQAVATPAKKRYKDVVAVPGRLHARLERENRAIKAELELMQLKLAEARLQAKEAMNQAIEHGKTVTAMLLKIVLFMLCLTIVAWVLDSWVVDLSLENFEDWLMSDDEW